MTYFKSALIGTALFLGTVSYADAQNSCPEVSSFDGLIFDAGAFSAQDNMESYLERALKLGVEKVVLFPHPASTKGNTPVELEKVFPDLVVQGNKPWSKAAPVIWPEPLTPDMLSILSDEMQQHHKRTYLLSGITRFNPDVISRLVQNTSNLWLGLNKDDLDALVQNCGENPWQNVLIQAEGRVVFSSFGLNHNWKAYKQSVKSLRYFIRLLEPEQSEAVAYRNAETLYNLAVNAP